MVPSSAVLHTRLSAILSSSSALALALSCAHGGGGAWSDTQREEVLERGGELAEAPPELALRVTPTLVSVWGITEVPVSARLQVALSGVDALTRAELLKAIEVRVSEVVTSVDSADPRRRSIVVETTEAARGVLARGAPLPHGWARIKRGDAALLRIWARLDVPRASLEAALRSTLGPLRVEVSPLVGGLALAPPDASP